MTRRLHLVRDLTDLPADPPPPGYRELMPRDAARLGRLLLDAYRGTTDDAGEGIAEAVAEINRTLGGSYGEMCWEASLVVEEHDELQSACLITLQGEPPEPLVAFSMTAARAKGKGYAKGLLAQALRLLSVIGAARVFLYVTETNAPALNLYRQMGFTEVDA